MSQKIRAAILETFEKSVKKGKKMIHVNEAPKQVRKNSPDFKSREIKKSFADLVKSGELAYWSSGSSSYYMLKEEFEKYQETMEGDHED